MDCRKWARRFVTAGIAGTLIAPVSTAVASADAKGTTQITVTASSRPPTETNASGGSVAAACNRYDRTQVCQVTNVQITVLRNGVPIGYLYARMTQGIIFNVKRRTFTEYDTFTTTRIVGNATGNRAMLSVSCGNPCRAVNKFPRGRLLRQGHTIKGKITYTDNVRRGKVHNTASRYVMTFVKPGFTPGVVTWKSIGYRCDDTIKSQGAGCVIPRFKPTLTTMKTLPNIAAHIRRIQDKSPGHYGKPGFGHPLHKLKNAKKQKSNRRAVCGRSVVGPPPPGKNCDEYPFASTYEGGTKLSKKNRGVAWVPKFEQDRQGNRIAAFARRYRVLDKDAFWVGV